MCLPSHPRLVMRWVTKTFGPNTLILSQGLPLSAHSHCKAAAKPLANTAGSAGRTQPGWSPLCEARDACCCQKGYRDIPGLPSNQSPPHGHPWWGGQFDGRLGTSQQQYDGLLCLDHVCCPSCTLPKPLTRNQQWQWWQQQILLGSLLVWEQPMLVYFYYTICHSGSWTTDVE